MDVGQDGSLILNKASVRSGWLRALWAGLLSLIWPGLGQIYAYRWGLGVGLFAAAIALDFSFLGLTWIAAPIPGVVVLGVGIFLIFRIFVVMDAVRRARLLREAMPLPWYRSAWFAAIVMIAISLSIGLGDMTDARGWRSFHIASASNMPTLLSTDYILADVRPGGRNPDYGDVVVFRLSRDPKVIYAKRVVGLPGDRVQLREAILYLNGKPMPHEPHGLPAPFLSAPGVHTLKQYREALPNGRTYMIFETPQSALQNTTEFTVPPGHIFVLGDNRGNSLDSRSGGFGYIPLSNVIGTVRTIYWPGLHEPDRFLSRVN